MHSSAQRFLCDVVRCLYDPLGWIVFCNLVQTPNDSVIDYHLATTVHADIRSVRKHISALHQDGLIVRKGDTYSVDLGAALENMGKHLRLLKQKACVCKYCQTPVDLISMLLETTEPKCSSCGHVVESFSIEADINALYARCTALSGASNT